MTKKEQLKKEVTEAWDMLNMVEHECGEDSEDYINARARWYGLDRAWNIMFDGERY